MPVKRAECFPFRDFFIIYALLLSNPNPNLGNARILVRPPLPATCFLMQTSTGFGSETVTGRTTRDNVGSRAGVSGNSRSRPFPGIPASHSRSQSLGMSFSFPFPFPKVGNGFFHSRSQNLGMQFSIPVPVSGNGLYCREKNGNGVQKLGIRGLLTDRIDVLDISLGHPLGCNDFRFLFENHECTLKFFRVFNIKTKRLGY